MDKAQETTAKWRRGREDIQVERQRNALATQASGNAGGWYTNDWKMGKERKKLALLYQMFHIWKTQTKCDGPY